MTGRSVGLLLVLGVSFGCHQPVSSIRNNEKAESMPKLTLKRPQDAVREFVSSIRERDREKFSAVTIRNDSHPRIADESFEYFCAVDEFQKLFEKYIGAEHFSELEKTSGKLTKLRMNILRLPHDSSEIEDLVQLVDDEKAVFSMPSGTQPLSIVFQKQSKDWRISLLPPDPTPQEMESAPRVLHAFATSYRDAASAIEGGERDWRVLIDIIGMPLLKQREP